MYSMLLLGLSVGVAAEPDKTKDELPKIQGIWKVTAMESRGAERQPPQPFGATERYTLVVVGDTYVFLTHAGTIKLTPGDKAVDLAITDGRYKDKNLLGLYEMKDDTLKIAMATPLVGGERPKEMKTGADTSYTVYTFTREKATKEQAEAKLKELKTSVAQTAAIRDRGPGGPAFAPPDRATQELLKQVIEKLDRIEKRLDEMEKKEKEKK